MPRPNPGPRLRLYGPDTRFGARYRPRFTRYAWYLVWSEGGRKLEKPTGAGFSGSPTAGDRAQAEEALRRFLENRAEWRGGVRRPDQVTIADLLKIYA